LENLEIDYSRLPVQKVFRFSKFPMNRLNLSPLPRLRSERESGAPQGADNGFVDEAVILALIAGPVIPRRLPDASDLALAPDNMDFAGWDFARPTRGAEATTAPSETSTRRPSPPLLEEAGIGEPHRGSHRWWLAGLAGAISTLLVSALLLSLSSPTASDSTELSIVRRPAKPQVEPDPKTEIRKSVPELTEVSPVE